MADMKKKVEESKEIEKYLNTTDKSEEEKQSILDDCWKDEAENEKWLKKARASKPKDEPKDDNGKKKASASHNDGHQQMRDAITAIEKNLIARARMDVHQAIQYGNGNPVTVAQDAVTKAISSAVDDIRGATTLAFRK